MSDGQKADAYQGHGQRYDKVHYGGSSRRRVSAFELMKFLKKPPSPAKTEIPKPIKTDQR